MTPSPEQRPILLPHGKEGQRVRVVEMYADADNNADNDTDNDADNGGASSSIMVWDDAPDVTVE